MLLGEPIPRVGEAREDELVRRLDIRTEEIPCLSDEVVGLVESDVTSPDDLRSGLFEGAAKRSGLRIVDENDVALFDQRRQLAGGLVANFFEDRVLRIAQRAPITSGSVKVIVQALGQTKEVGVPTDRDPPGVDPSAPRIGQE